MAIESGRQTCRRTFIFGIRKAGYLIQSERWPEASFIVMVGLHREGSSCPTGMSLGIGCLANRDGLRPQKKCM